MPEKIEAFRDSFRVGWKEADDQIAIERQRQNAKEHTTPQNEA